MLEEYFAFEKMSVWWDLDENNIDVFYTKYLSGHDKWYVKYSKSADAWAFVSKEKNGQFYLYISITE